MANTSSHSQLLIVFGVHLHATDCTSLPELEQYFTLHGFEDVAAEPTTNATPLIHLFKSNFFGNEVKLTVIQTDADKVVNVRF